MAKLAISCPHCQYKGFIEEANLKGKPVNIKCPKCKQSFVYHQQGRIAYRRAPLPNVRYGPFGFNFSSLPNEGQILDISQTGMKIQVFKQPPSPKERYNFKFRLPIRDEEVKVSGEAVWVKKETDSLYKVGIEFINADVHSRKLISFFLKDPLPKVFYGPIGLDFSNLTQEGRLLDISQTGMKIQVFKQPPSPKERYNFKFRLPIRDEEVKVSGEAVWVKKETDSLYKVGIKFINVDVHSRKLIGFFLMP